MPNWSKIAKEYVTTRRAFGFKLKHFERRLGNYAAFLETNHARRLTVSAAVTWACLNAKSGPGNHAQRLGVARNFARYYVGADPRTEIPPETLLPFRPARPSPFIYSNKQVRELLASTWSLWRDAGLLRATYYTLFGLLAVTGMRINEALNLRLADVDLESGVLTVRGAKFGQSRLVPIHSSTSAVLARFRKIRDRYLLERRDSDYFFVSLRGGRIDSASTRVIFYRLSRKIGLRGLKATRGPRIHDLRHRFAVETLVRWYRRGADVEARIPSLSTYLGHARPAHTYWYLTACPELMGLAAGRLEQRWNSRL